LFRRYHPLSFHRNANGVRVDGPLIRAARWACG
jgi:hypothetical protein